MLSASELPVLETNFGATAGNDSSNNYPIGFPQSQNPAQNLIFVDRAINDVDTLLQGLESATVILIDTAEDGVVKITETLTGYQNIASVQIFSHGSDAQVSLGNAQLNTDTLNQYADELIQWGQALDPTGDIFFYGCNVAATSAGVDFIDQISTLTGADVAASSDLTGYLGDWHLEFETGSIESTIALSASAQRNFSETLVLLNNGGFESGLNNWDGFNGQEQISTTESFSGSNSLQLSNADSGIGQFVAATAGETYDLTGHAKSSSNGYSAFGLSFFDANYSFLDRQETGNINTANWQEYQLNATAPGNTAFVQVWAYKGTNNGNTFIDDLTLAPDTGGPPPVDTTPPSATISTANISSTGNSSYEFSITYSDATAVDISTLDNSDVNVTGPNGFDQFATLVNIDESTDGSPRTATYQINTPGGSWDESDNGSYTVAIQAGQIADTNGNVIDAQTTTFEVNISGTPGGGGNEVLSNGGFESGLANWDQFSGQEQISTTESFSGTGSLQLSSSNSGTGQLADGIAGETYSLTGYAKSSSNGYSAFGLNFFDANFNVLDGVETNSINNANWQQYQLSETAPSGTVFVQVWTYKGTNNGDTFIDDLSLTVDAGGAPPTDTTPPDATISAANISSEGSSDYTFSVTYSDNTAIDVSTLDNSDIRVTGPNGFNQLATLVSVNNNTDGTPRTGTYRINAPGGNWEENDNGTYAVAIQANEISDTNGNILATESTSFEVNISGSPGGGGTELLTNGGFESGLASWDGFSGQEQISTTESFSGTGSLALSNADNGIGQILAGTAGETYTLEGYAKSSSSGYSAFGLNFFDANFNFLDRVETGSINNANWQQYQLNRTAPSGTAFVQVWGYKGSNDGTTFIDDLSLKTDAGGPPPADTTPPTATINTTDINNGGANTYDFSITYSDDTAISVTTLDDSDIRVTGPNGFNQLATLVTVNNNTDGSPRTATYRINAPGGSWQESDNGTYAVALQSGEVGDTSGNTAATTTTNFEVNISSTGGAPNITSNGGGATATLSLGEGTTLVTDVNATGNGLTYEIVGGADASDFAIDAVTGELSFQTTPDYEAPVDSNGDNIYDVTVQVSNSAGQDTQALSVAVTNEVSVYLLGGQSNMVGLGENNQLPANLQDPYPAVQIWQVDIQSFSDLRPGFAGPNGNWPEFGPELTFGRGIDGFADEEVFLIKHATGSTNLANDWDPDGANNVEYDIFVDRVDDALTQLTNQNIGYTVEGMLWMQGEADAFVPTFANAYEANLTAFIADMRSRYGAGMEFSIGKLHDPFAVTVRNAQEAVAAADPLNSIVNTDNFEILPDEVHYSTQGQIDLGFGFADALK